jgi:GNAT superfamily N-acetyltransferase
MTPKIRPAVLEDAPAISAILRELDYFTHIVNVSAQEVTDRVARHLELCIADDSHAVLVAENETGVVGYAAVHWLAYLLLPGPEGYLSELFVREGERGTGIGTALLEAVIERARDIGCYRLMLTNGRDRPAYRRGFYQKRGWTERPYIANFVLLLQDDCESKP